MTILLKDFSTDDKGKCNGQVFRGRTNAYINRNGDYVYQERMVRLKRKSCPGCAHCGYLQEDLLERAYDGSKPIQGIEDGALYELQVTNVSTDWESGTVDDWDIEFVEIEE